MGDPSEAEKAVRAQLAGSYSGRDRAGEIAEAVVELAPVVALAVADGMQDAWEALVASGKDAREEALRRWLMYVELLTL